MLYIKNIPKIIHICPQDAKVILFPHFGCVMVVLFWKVEAKFEQVLDDNVTLSAFPIFFVTENNILNLGR